jgi:hypothetical protein
LGQRLKSTTVQSVRVRQQATQKFPGMRCRAISAQFMANGVIALFELTLQDDEIRVAQERHHRLVPASELDESAIKAYKD